MDPRKTVVIADFEEVMRGVKEAAALEQQPSAARFGAKTVERSSADDVRPSAPAVVVSRTLIAGEPRNLALAKTQVWRGEPKVDAESGSRERAQVHVDESVMQHLSAEVWAGQAARGARVMMTTVRRSIVDLRSMPVEPHRSESHAMRDASATRPTQISTELLDPPRIPRHFQLPSAKAIRIAAVVVGAASIALLGFSIIGSAGKPEARAASAQKQPAVAAPVRAAAAASGPQTAALPQEASSLAPASAGAGEHDTPAPSVTSASQREAVDALIAGKHPLALARYRALARNHPNAPAYAVAARILEEAQQRSAE